MVQEDKIKLGDLSVSVKIAGQGKNTVLFIHGASMSSDSWLPQLESLGAIPTLRLIAVDLPGHGRSDAFEDPARYRPCNLGFIVPTLLRHYEVESFILVGLSYGTMVIGELIEPITGCCGIMLVSPFILNEQYTPANVLIPSPFGYVMVSEEPSDDELNAFIAQCLVNTAIASRGFSEFRSTARGFRTELGRLMVDKDWTDELKNIAAWKVPVCVVFGEGETLIKTDYLDDFTALWEHGVIIIKKSGHVVNEEQPEAFNGMLVSFCESVFK